MSIKLRRVGVLALAGCVLLCLVGAFSTLAHRAEAQLSGCPQCSQGAVRPSVPLSDDVLAQLRVAVEEYIAADTVARHWVLEGTALDTIRHGRDQERVEAAFLVERWHRLDYAQPEDVPAFKGRLRCLMENHPRLAEGQFLAASAENDSWRQELVEYIEETQYAGDFMHALGRLDKTGSLIPSSVSLYLEDPLGELFPASLDSIPTEAQAELIGYEAMEEICRDAARKPQEAGVMALYDRIAARDYANTWTSNPTTGWCKGQTVDCLQDDTKYNRTAYTTWYCCADCANYVSQGVRAGGIPTDTTWKPYTLAWVNVGALCTYMDTTKNYWDTTTIGNCLAGYPFTITGHIMMMVYNDGTTRKYSAHTNDRLKVVWSGSATYYKVTY